MQFIGAIETQYNGHRFRSRLEARWAIFLDTLGIPFTYELEGYVLGNAGRYLPDFHLPHGAWSCTCPWDSLELPPEPDWLEIKPLSFNIAPKHLQQFFTLGAHTHHGVACIAGDPWPSRYALTRYYADTETNRPFEWAECLSCHAVYMHYESQGHFCRHCIYHLGLEWHGDRSLFSRGEAKGTRLHAAFVAARSARFEHGDREK